MMATGSVGSRRQGCSEGQIDTTSAAVIRSISGSDETLTRRSKAFLLTTLTRLAFLKSAW